MDLFTDQLFDQARQAYERYWYQMAWTNKVEHIVPFRQLPLSLQTAWMAVMRPFFEVYEN
jgi:hypothetical protein